MKAIKSSNDPSTWKPIIVELWNMINDNPEWSAAFQAAIDEANCYDLPEMVHIKNSNDYCRFMNDYVTWVPTEDKGGQKIYNIICLSYFIIDQPAMFSFQTQIIPQSAERPLTRLSHWIVKFAKSLGTDWLDQPGSLTKESLETFYNSPQYHMEDFKVPTGGWKTFNEFFAREFLPGKRPIGKPHNPYAIISPIDGVFDGYWDINSENEVVFIKGVPWSITQLLQGSRFTSAFKNGKFTHSFLSPVDYHRQHAPVSGTVLETILINGTAYLEVGVKTKDNKAVEPIFGPPANSPHGNPDHHLAMSHGAEMPDHPGYQFLQLRGLIVIDSPIGLVAVLPVGMAQVCSVHITCKVGQEVVKGQEISFFQFGGSDCIMVFEEKARVDFPGMEVGKHYKYGEVIARARLSEVKN